MATKDRRKLQHIHSSIADKQPTPQSLEVGEIAVNNSAKKEFLSIKNSDDKVVRFSSDSTIIDWIEKKEVMPYSGVVDNVHLDTNRSNIEIKINQVAAKNTPKYDKINGAVDIDGQPVNPSTDDGKTDGAGIAIDMSRYAMIGANPSFSSVTVTHRSNLSGTTNISNGAGGEVLNITTTNVNANDTNWTETITNKKSTVTTEEDKITTLKESATTRTTVVGTENLTVSGTTTEVHKGNVTITNSANVTATTNGTMTETKVGNVTENNSANKQENTTGTHKLYTTGDTCIDSQANANFYGKGSTNIGVACDGTKGSATTVYGTTTTISGNTTNVTGATTLNLSGNTINERALTANTNVTSAYTSATTATTVIGTANTSATTATLSGNTLDITEATSISAKTPSTYVSGTNLSVVETNTDIESCGRISGKTNAFTIQECAAGNGKTVINQTDIKASGKTLSFDETTSISAKTPSTTLSGTNLTVNETNTTINSCGKVEITTDSYSLKQCSNTGGTAEFEFCNGYTVKSNAINLQQCGADGTINITSKTQNINGGSLTVNDSGNTAINVGGNLTENVTGTTTSTHTGAVTESNKAGYTVNTTGDTCLQSTADVNVGGAANTNIGTNCDDSVKANYVNIKAKSGITETANTVTISGTTSANISGATVNVSGNTTNISGATNLNMSGKTVNVDATDIDVDASNNYCLSAATKANIYGKTTNIGVECGGTTATTINISGTTINEGGTTNNNNFTTINNTATTINNKANFNITGNTTISGDTTIGGKLYLKPDCTSLTSTTVNAGLCEVLDRSAITIEKNTNPSDTRLATVYTIKQNGLTINTIEVAKDKALKSASVVQDTSGEWVIRLVWYTFDPDSGTESETTTDIPAKELVKDLEAVNPSDNGTAANHNVKLSVWYDATSGDNKISAETTPNMHVTNMYASNTVSGATVSGTTVKGATVSAGTLTATGNTTLAAASASSISATSITTPNLTGTSISSQTIEASTSVSTNALNATLVTASDTVNGTTVKGTNINATNSVSTSGLNTSGVVNLSNIVTVNPAAGQCVTIDRNLCVNGTVTSQQQIYSSDRNLKENINLVTDEEMDKVDNINYKSYNFKNDENKNKIYGVIAQDVQDAGLGELVYTNEDGNLAVDYTSLMILKLAHLRRVNYNLVAFISNLDNRMAQLESKNKKLESKIEELEGNKEK